MSTASTNPAHTKSYKRPNKVLLLDRKTCISCAGCVGTCPDEALDMFGLDLQVFQDKCTYCTLCVRFCPVGALSIEKHAPEGGENAVIAPKTPADFHWPAASVRTTPQQGYAQDAAVRSPQANEHPSSPREAGQ